MNKNIITGVLLVVILVMGFALIKTKSNVQQAATITNTETTSQTDTSAVVSGVVKKVAGAYTSKSVLSRDEVAKLSASKELECLGGAKNSEKGIMVSGECMTLSSLKDTGTLFVNDPPINPTSKETNGDGQCDEWVRVWYWTLVWGVPVYTYYWDCAHWLSPASAV